MLGHLTSSVPCKNSSVCVFLRFLLCISVCVGYLCTVHGDNLAANVECKGLQNTHLEKDHRVRQNNLFNHPDVSYVNVDDKFQFSFSFL